MRKLLLSVCLSAVSYLAFGQFSGISIRAGADFEKLQVSLKDANVNVTTGSKTAFSIGMFADFKWGNFYFEPALVYAGRGGQVTRDLTTGWFTLQYFEVPLNVVHHMPTPWGFVYIGTGPYVAYGVSGSDNIENSSGYPETQSVDFGGKGEYSSSDTGWDFIGGAQFKNGLIIHLNYDLGLKNILNKNFPDNEGASAKTSTFGLSVGYAF